MARSPRKATRVANRWHQRFSSWTVGISLRSDLRFFEVRSTRPGVDLAKGDEPVTRKRDWDKLAPEKRLMRSRDIEPRDFMTSSRVDNRNLPQRPGGCRSCGGDLVWIQNRNRWQCVSEECREFFPRLGWLAVTRHVAGKDRGGRQAMIRSMHMRHFDACATRWVVSSS